MKKETENTSRAKKEAVANKQTYATRGKCMKKRCRSDGNGTEGTNDVQTEAHHVRQECEDAELRTLL